MSRFKLSKQTAEVYNQLYSVYYAYDQRSRIYYAKIFSINRLQQYGLDETLQYNQQVLSDLDGMAFPEHINKVIHSIPNDGMFTFITDPYEINLQQYMITTRITQPQALKIFDNILKAIYSIYATGYWHKNIRPEHFVKIGNIWKLDSLVYSEDITHSKGLQSEYTWNSAYQAPQVYQKNIQTFSDEDFLQMVVWNLGSLLLDLFFSVHKLKNLDVMKGCKGKKFTLEDIKVKKTDIFSKKLKDILAQMLHYDPKSRMKLQEVFLSEYLSKQVASVFKKKHKNSLIGAIKIFTGGRSALSSALLSKQQRQKGSKILPINEVIKSAIDNLETQMIKTFTSRDVKSLNQIQTDEDLIEKVSLFSHFLKKKIVDSCSTKSNTKELMSIEQMLTNQQLEVAVKIYKSNIDKSDMLSIAGQKIYEINEKDNRKEISLLSKYAVQVYSYLNLDKILSDMNRNLNSLVIQANLYSKFQNSTQFKALKKIINRKLQQKYQKIIKIREQLNKLEKKQRKFIQENQIKIFIAIDLKKLCFQQIKGPYRKILKLSYDYVTKQYNKDSNDQKLARLAMYIVYSLTIDKLYIPNMIEKNFEAYFEWSKQKPDQYVSIVNFQRYIEQASIKTLVQHAKSILQKYFKL